jgi:hypothetical protein
VPVPESHVCHDSVTEVVAFASALSLLLGTLQGHVSRGPITPVCRAGNPCDGPAVHVRLFFVRDGTTSTAVTDARGFYRVRLGAGTYRVRTDQRPFGVTPQPRTVRVVGGGVRRVDFHIDTGIR